MKQKLNENQESATVQSVKQNVQDEPTAESRSAPAAEAGREPQAGGGSAPSPCSALDGAFVARFIAGEATPKERKNAWQVHEKEYNKLAENLSQEVGLKYLSEVDEYKDIAKSLKEVFDLIATLPKKSNSVSLEELGLQV